MKQYTKMIMEINTWLYFDQKNSNINSWMASLEDFQVALFFSSKHLFEFH